MIRRTRIRVGQGQLRIYRALARVDETACIFKDGDMTVLAECGRPVRLHREVVNLILSRQTIFTSSINIRTLRYVHNFL